MDYWNGKSDNERHKMNEVFKEQVETLELIIPNFKVANATAHYDETSPHLHVIGVAYKENCKRGLERQVGKSSVFTKTSLSEYQDIMRDNCIKSFNKIYNKNYVLKEKEDGRNHDINVKDMGNYREIKKEKEKYVKKLNELNDKTNNLKNSSDSILKLIDELKTSKLNKDNLIISKEQADEIKNYIELTNQATDNLKDSNDLLALLDKYEKDLKTHSNEIKVLERKVEVRDEEIEKLKDDNYYKDSKIDELEDKVDKLEELVNYFKNLWNKLMAFLHEKFFSSNQYDDLIDEMQDEEILSPEDVGKINGSISIEKDDFEL